MRRLTSFAGASTLSDLITFHLLQSPLFGILFTRFRAQVVKLVDALASGASIRKDVMVRVHSWAPTPFPYLLL